MRPLLPCGAVILRLHGRPGANIIRSYTVHRNCRLNSRFRDRRGNYSRARDPCGPAHFGSVAGRCRDNRSGRCRYRPVRRKGLRGHPRRCRVRTGNSDQTYCTNRHISGTRHDTGRLGRNCQRRRRQAQNCKVAHWADAALLGAPFANRHKPVARLGDNSPARSLGRCHGEQRGAPLGVRLGVTARAPDRRFWRAPATWRREAGWEGCEARRSGRRGRRNCRLRSCNRVRPGGCRRLPTAPARTIRESRPYVSPISPSVPPLPRCRGPKTAYRTGDLIQEGRTRQRLLRRW